MKEIMSDFEFNSLITELHNNASICLKYVKTWVDVSFIQNSHPWGYRVKEEIMEKLWGK